MISIEIKEATKSAHLDLEKKVVQQLKSIRSQEDYAALLKYFYAYFHHVEKAIAPFITGDVLPDYTNRRHAGHIKNDLEALGSSTDGLPDTTVPVIGNRFRALGALYVMEGSIMGGSIIVKMLEKGGITKGISFFSGYGEATPTMWGVFTGVLNQQASDKEQKDMVIQTANETFEHFSRVFDQADHVQQSDRLLS